MYASKDHTFKLYEGDATAAANGDPTIVPNARKQFFLAVDGVGAVAASFDIVVSPDGKPEHEEWVCTLTASGTTNAIQRGSLLELPGQVYRAKRNSISGTGAVATVFAEV